jgi:hypothetical protein
MYLTKLLSVVALTTLAVQGVSAKGRRGDYVSTPQEERRTARPGSVANPNPAYRAPDFGGSAGPSARPASQRQATAPIRTGSQLPPEPSANAPVPNGAAGQKPTSTPAPSGPMTPADPSEPALPGLATDEPPTK